jgi:hypothetical protein
MVVGEEGFDATGHPALDSYALSLKPVKLYTKKASSFDEAFEWWSVKRESMRLGFQPPTRMRFLQTFLIHIRKKPRLSTRLSNGGR